MSRNKPQESKLVVYTASQLKTSTEKQSYVTVKWAQLKDTTINDVSLTFITIDKKKYDSLSIYAIETEVPLESFEHLVTKANGCQLVKLNNGIIDSLCDKHEKSGYFETYTIKGLWKEKGQLLVNFQNWEDNDDFFVDLQDGFIYHLSTGYRISPNKNLLLGYTKDNLIPLYGSNFMYAGVSNYSIKTYFNIDLGQIAIKDLKWTKDSECLISTGDLITESGEFKLKNELYYLMRISQ